MRPDGEGADRLPKVFHGLANFGTQSGLFARELRKRGFDAISVTGPDPFNRQTDVVLQPPQKGVKGLPRRLANYFRCLKWMLQYDLFHFYYGSSLLPRQLDLPLYRWLGKRVIMEYLGNDIQGYAESVRKYRWTNVNHMMTPEEGACYDERIQRRRQFEKRYVDETLVCAPAYSEFADDAQVISIAVDVNGLLFAEYPPFEGVLRIMHAPTNRGFKGTESIVATIGKLIAEGHRIELDLVEKVSHDQLLKRFQSCHLFIDQILGGWYGTAAIEAMAVGRPVVAFLRKEYERYIDFASRIPVISADPDTLEEVLRNVLQRGPGWLRTLGEQSREFVEQYHSVERVVDQLIPVYERVWTSRK